MKSKKSKIILIIITIILMIIVIFLAYLLFRKFVLKKNFENDVLSFANKNQETVFSINKIVLFSSADSKNKSSSASNFTIENLYQYTDIALFIANNGNNSMENTFKNVYIDNIKFDTTPVLGEPKLYFKSINNFAKSDIIEDNLINDKFDFTITSDDNADLNYPILYNNLANPITLSYVNQNIKSDYTITDTSTPITYDGSLLSKCNIDLNSISAKLSFNVNIVNNLDEKFKTTVFINIPLQDNDKSIINGSLTLKQDVNYTFYRY